MARQKLDIVRLQPASMDLAWVNKEVLTEILLWLPAKFLIRCKSVCKEWLSLISSDYFCHQHTLCRPKLERSLIIEMHRLQFFYFNGTTNGGKVMIPYSLSVPDHQILQGCNGLLLLILKPLENSTVSITKEYSYYVYNPTTRRSRKITLTNNDKLPYVKTIALAFDPSKSPYYKIVCVRSSTESRNIGPYTYQIEVYDSESHTWNLSFEPLISQDYLRISSEGIHWNNSIYSSFSFDEFCGFDIAKNEIKRLVRPHGHGGDQHRECYLQESNGRLYHFELLENKRRVSVAVWELGGDDQSQWLFKHRGKIKIYQDGYKVGVLPVRLMVGSDGDETCSLVVYEYKDNPDPNLDLDIDPEPELEPETEPGRMMAYNFLDKNYDVLVDFTCQPDVKTSAAIGFQFGEILALV